MKKSGLGVMIAVGPAKKRPGGDDLSGPGPLGHQPPDAGEAGDAGDEQEEQPDGDEGGIGPEDVDYREGELCKDCAHMGQDGKCQRYKFPVGPEGHCEGGFEPLHQGGAGSGDVGGESAEGLTDYGR